MTVDTAVMSEHAPRVGRDHCLAPERVDAPIYGGRYRSLFPDLPALEADEAAVHALGRAGGLCDLGIDFPDEADGHARNRSAPWTPSGSRPSLAARQGASDWPTSWSRLVDRRVE